MKLRPNSNLLAAFSLIEMLLVLAIISVMAGMVVTSYSNAARDSRNNLSRQQQATLQSALNNWISDTAKGDVTVGMARRLYNFGTMNTKKEIAADGTTSGAGGGTKQTSAQRLAMIEDYLDDEVFSSSGSSALTIDTDGKVRSDAMRRTGQHVQFGDWVLPSANSTPYPKVELLNG